MRIDNHQGLPAGDTEDPILISSPRGGTPAMIDSARELAEVASRLAAGTAPIALDVERAQGYRYGSDPYLVQIRREDVGTFLIDSHALPDLSSLAPGTDDLWILHAADQDLPNLAAVGLRPATLFDTEVAARLIGLERFGLAAVCEQVMGLSLAKDHQAANWSIRPLPSDWLRYAALDVELLTEAYRHLATRLHDLGRWEWASEEFDHVIRLPAPAPKPDRWRSLPGIGKLSSPRSLEVLRLLWFAREDLARELDIAPGRLVKNSALIQAASNPPRNRRSLLQIQDFRIPTARAHTDIWLRAITTAIHTPDNALPPRRVPTPAGTIPESRFWARNDPQAHARLQAVRAAVKKVADPLQMAPDVVLEPKVQRYLAWAPLDSGLPVSVAVQRRLAETAARPWQVELTFAELVAALKS
ncbi:MAG: HRDC domain-containing protein [Actinomycetaceae bacterium]|nr:HRDC domain-containing protein [Actinomycetaceae bacterium]